MRHHRSRLAPETRRCVPSDAAAIAAAIIDPDCLPQSARSFPPPAMGESHGRGSQFGGPASRSPSLSSRRQSTSERVNAILEVGVDATAPSSPVPGLLRRGTDDASSFLARAVETVPTAWAPIPLNRVAGTRAKLWQPMASRQSTKPRASYPRDRARTTMPCTWQGRIVPSDQYTSDRRGRRLPLLMPAAAQTPSQPPPVKGPMTTKSRGCDKISKRSNR